MVQHVLCLNYYYTGIFCWSGQRKMPFAKPGTNGIVSRMAPLLQG